MISRLCPSAFLILFVSSAGAQPAIGPCKVFPASNIWNIPIDQLPVSANSATLVNTIGPSSYLHADFGSGTYAGGPIGIPFVTVPGTQTKYPATFQYASESDPGPYAVPLNAPIEGGSQSTGDRHAIAVDTDNCILYELYSAYPQTASWQAGSGAIFDLNSNALRPAGWTSADAAGLPIFPGLVRYEEVAAGEIRHAIRLTVPDPEILHLAREALCLQPYRSKVSAHGPALSSAGQLQRLQLSRRGASYFARAEKVRHVHRRQRHGLVHLRGP
jgi:hypothetical protein